MDQTLKISKTETEKSISKLIQINNKQEKIMKLLTYGDLNEY